MAAPGIPDILAICDEALEREGSERQGYLDTACAGDDELRRQVEAVLACQACSKGFLETPPWSAAAPPLAAGTRLGPYEVTGTLGAGGMGRVYRARDTRLGRTVALKVIADARGIDVEARDRFLAEARAIASLNNPHICALHDIGCEGAIDFLVMEYVDGETLAARLARGALPLRTALEYGAQLADALARAHRQGIVHRDLKPGNVMLTKSGVKLLDFGLARLAESAGAPAASGRVSAASAVAGTLPYMAPEQLRGLGADARSDVFAFGAVLYEMIGGARAFEGETEAAAARAVLEHEPPRLSSLKPEVPASLDHLVGRCLAKDPEERWQSASDVAAQLEWMAATPGAADVPARRETRGRARRILLGAAAVLTALAIIALLASRALRPPVSSPSYRFAVTAPPGATLTDRGIAISPDGRTLAFVASAGDAARLYVRRLDDWTATALEATAGASLPFFSPDGQWIAYSPPGGGLMKVPTAGGPGQVVWAGDRLESRIVVGASWGPEGIVFGRWPDTGLSIVAPENGTPRPLTTVGKAGHWQMWPEMLPGGKALLFTTWQHHKTSITAVTLASGEEKTIVRSGTRARYLRSGQLVYESGGDLLAVPFDPATLEMKGTPRTVIPGVGKAEWTATARSSFIGRSFDISPSGTLVYAPPPNTPARLLWVDRQGRIEPLPLEPGRYFMPALSPDGQRVADTFVDGPTRSVWIGSVHGGAMMRLTPGDDDCYSLFSRDGRWVLYTSNQDDRYNIYRIASDGSGAPERLTNSPNAQRATSSSPEGVVLLNDIHADRGDPRNVDILALEGRTLVPVVKTKFWERGAVFSPDGRYIAYDSNESGRMEVYVQRYPRGAKAKVSRDGGQGAIWNPRGGELFFQGPDAVMAARIVDGVPAGAPVRLFPHRSEQLDWDVHLDGERFLVVEGGDARKSPPQIFVVVNWLDQLQAKLPTRPPVPLPSP